MTSTDTVREFYDDFVDYQTTFLSRPNPRFEEIRRRLTPFLDRAPSGALDIGCGIGIQTDWLSARIDHVVGVDVSPRSIAFARALYDRPSFETCNLPGQTLPEGPFDLVTAFDVVEHFPSASQGRSVRTDRRSARRRRRARRQRPVEAVLASESRRQPAVIDEAVGADEIVALAATQGLEPLSLERYGLEAVNQYVFCAFSRTYDVQSSPPLPSPARRLLGRAAAVRPHREKGRLLARVKDL